LVLDGAPCAVKPNAPPMAGAPDAVKPNATPGDAAAGGGGGADSEDLDAMLNWFKPGAVAVVAVNLVVAVAVGKAGFGRV
jgi:hypothetical protein